MSITREVKERQRCPQLGSLSVRCDADIDFFKRRRPYQDATYRQVEYF